MLLLLLATALYTVFGDLTEAAALGGSVVAIVFSGTLIGVDVELHCVRAESLERLVQILPASA